MDNTSTNDIELTIKGNVDKRCEAGNERGEAGLYFIWPNIKKYLLLMVWSKEERNVVRCTIVQTLIQNLCTVLYVKRGYRVVPSRILAVTNETTYRCSTTILKYSTCTSLYY